MPLPFNKSRKSVKLFIQKPIAQQAKVLKFNLKGYRGLGVKFYNGGQTFAINAKKSLIIFVPGGQFMI
jgi:hypothetical protein